jgi:transcription-repair coupling factor (superfamily II helicase)
MLAEAVEHARARRESRPAVVERPGATVDLPVDAHLPDGYVPDEAQKLEVYRRLAKVATAGGLAALRQEIADRFGPMPAPVARLTEVVELRLAAEAAGIAAISREEGELVVRFGTLDRATATRGLAGLSPSLRVFSNQARIRLPRDPERAWALAEAVVARIAEAVRGAGAGAGAGAGPSLR